MIFKRTTDKYGDTPTPQTPYQKASQAWDERIGSARIQARNWRLMAFGCLALLASLSGALIWQSLQSRITPYVIEVDTLGEVRTIGPATVTYKPSDAQIAYQLAAFINRVRAVSVDPIVVREQWLAAYDFTTDRAAQILNEYARENDPFTDVGRRSIAVEVTSVVRASEDSFQIKWTERHYRSGAFQKMERYTAILTIIFQQPATVTVLTKNPLGLYVHGLNWSRDMDTPERE
ncbi:conjugal transfer protein TrbF [Paremcibacter congregatus]|uniref:conjugal transfer protein TrbF n=1 Tax=Paremcibacter congregatus TaxID=2043170 RepID=UPI0030ED2DB9